MLADVAVPAAQAALTAGLGAAGTYAIWGRPNVAATGALIVGTVTWAVLMVDHRRLLRHVEEWTRLDIDRDGTIGQPSRDSIELSVQIHEQGRGPRHLFEDVDVSEAAFRTWARSVVNGRSLSVSSWTGKGKPFSRGDYEALLDVLTEARVVEWVNPKATSQGRQLTRMGKAALTEWLGGAK
jgi:hypothetical protein